MVYHSRSGGDDGGTETFNNDAKRETVEIFFDLVSSVVCRKEMERIGGLQVCPTCSSLPLPGSCFQHGVLHRLYSPITLFHRIFSKPLRVLHLFHLLDLHRLLPSFASTSGRCRFILPLPTATVFLWVDEKDALASHSR
ncbi:unnamed protein product [Lactuca saligna]|uniref:Uncharacterized protein n=1 Tax=Lactuca saligna TaxID=75948 RepID=A0AA35Z5X8_LACSI|nr:unnamed protein product [Lactuca saligna]